MTEAGSGTASASTPGRPASSTSAAEPAAASRRRRLDPASAEIRTTLRRALAAADRAGAARWVVALSGGPDSTALAAAAAFLRSRGEAELTAAVVDHGLQAGSADVAAAAAAWGESIGLPTAVLTADVPAAEPRAGLEAAARTARYSALSAHVSGIGAAGVLTGHTRDDQAESVLLGLMRGSGTRSLAGMAPDSDLDGLRVLRPLLEITRAQTVASCAAIGAEPWQDPMNEDPRFARVRARRALALLEGELGRDLSPALARTAALTRADADCLDELASAAESLSSPHRAVRTRALRTRLLEAGCPAQELRAEHIVRVDDALTERAVRRIELPGGVDAVCARGELSLDRRPGS